MRAQRIVKSQEAHSKELNDLATDSIKEIKGKRIVELDLRGLEDAPASYFIICEGDSNTQIKAISDNISKNVKDKIGVLPNHVEGKSFARWILIGSITLT